ncbi:hypothetical protein PILCRDRAFT_394720 [Piloderma croceum F 1598]|uniref:Uncharacterized protein n=1 Tax=Piloderma croceum (strain F 1598) TaxID=765440 RepID=A0A0C3FKZ5_PILCF|nr:hypothetical protein PILCRDRAFT_394720 [Piloderma croceum F 1598]
MHNIFGLTVHTCGIFFDQFIPMRNTREFQLPRPITELYITGGYAIWTSAPLGVLSTSLPVLRNYVDRILGVQGSTTFVAFELNICPQNRVRVC